MPTSKQENYYDEYGDKIYYDSELSLRNIMSRSPYKNLNELRRLIDDQPGNLRYYLSSIFNPLHQKSFYFDQLHFRENRSGLSYSILPLENFRTHGGKNFEVFLFVNGKEVSRRWYEVEVREGIATVLLRSDFVDESFRRLDVVVEKIHSEEQYYDITESTVNDSSFLTRSELDDITRNGKYYGIDDFYLYRKKVDGTYYLPESSADINFTDDGEGVKYYLEGDISSGDKFCLISRVGYWEKEFYGETTPLYREDDDNLPLPLSRKEDLKVYVDGFRVPESDFQIDWDGSPTLEIEGGASGTRVRVVSNDPHHENFTPRLVEDKTNLSGTVATGFDLPLHWEFLDVYLAGRRIPPPNYSLISDDILLIEEIDGMDISDLFVEARIMNLEYLEDFIETYRNNYPSLQSLINSIGDQEYIDSYKNNHYVGNLIN